MGTFRVERNIRHSICEVEADSKEQAIEVACQQDMWQEINDDDFEFNVEDWTELAKQRTN